MRACVRAAQLLTRLRAQGPNQWITDRVDGLITDATNSPFTTVILPYMYMDYPDRKVEWNVWTFDQGLASRVPYESAARTLTQRKQSFSGYTVRQGLAISMEHNFMMTTEGMENFQNQIKQVVGSIQNTNDLDVHMALITAPSYMMQVRERYYLDDYLSKALRDYIDTFGFVQKNMNAMDIIIEDTKSIIKNWGGDEPDFLLCSNKLCFQLTMTQERTSYFTQGTDGKKLLKDGPTLDVYRNLKIVKSKAFSLDEGSAPRDIMRRRVRVGEFYNGPLNGLTGVRLYDEDSDNFEVLGIDKIWRTWYLTALNGGAAGADANDAATPDMIDNGGDYHTAASAVAPAAGVAEKGLMLLRCNIEHYMLGVIIGKGGMDHLGATLWGQTEMSVFDDGQHGVWGMTYKYHERAMVFNEVRAPAPRTPHAPRTPLHARPGANLTRPARAEKPAQGVGRGLRRLLRRQGPLGHAVDHRGRQCVPGGEPKHLAQFLREVHYLRAVRLKGHRQVAHAHVQQFRRDHDLPRDGRHDDQRHQKLQPATDWRGPRRRRAQSHTVGRVRRPQDAQRVRGNQGRRGRRELGRDYDLPADVQGNIDMDVQCCAPCERALDVGVRAPRQRLRGRRVGAQRQVAHEFRRSRRRRLPCPLCAPARVSARVCNKDPIPQKSTVALMIQKPCSFDSLKSKRELIL